MSDDAERAYKRAVQANERMKEAWKNRIHAREEFDAALSELNEAGQDLARAWNERERGDD